MLPISTLIRLEDGRLARVWSATKSELLDGSKVLTPENPQVATVSAANYEFINAVFDLASRLFSIEHEHYDA